MTKIKIEYPNTDIGIKNALQHKDTINEHYKSITQPFPHAEIMVKDKITILWYNK